MDWTGFKDHRKISRQGNQDKFESETVYLISEKGIDVHVNKNGSYRIFTDKFGKVDIYPKANKVLITKDNKWISRGDQWIQNNILNLNKQT